MIAALVDSSVVLDVFTRDPGFYDRSLTMLADWGAVGSLFINQIIYAEVSIGFRRIEDLDDALNGSVFVIRSIPNAAAFLAARAYVAYRSRGGNRISPLPDFFIGAHAAVERLPLLTRDPDRVRTAYPTVRIVEP